MTSPPKRVLIVEDQRLVAADLEDTLKRLGYEVVGNVSSGEEAIPKAISARPDLALMDIRLRGPMDGIQAASAIRERMDIPVIYLTAYSDEETIHRAMLTSPFGYLVKPFNARELHAAIDIAIYKHATDRALAEERARRHAAEEFKFLVEGVQDCAICLVDLAGRVMTWNIGAERILGYPPAEIIGQHVSAFYPPEDIRQGKPGLLLSAALERSRAEDEGWRVRKDGSRFWAVITLSALRDEQAQVRGFAKVTRDMTARRGSQLQLEESVARIRAMVSGALDCIVSIDASGRVTDWNPAAEHTFGYRRDEAIGRELAELIIPERLRAQHRAGLERAIRTGEGPILDKRIEMPAVTRAGGELTVELSVTRIPVGSSPSFTGFLRDVTARKRAELDEKLHEAAQDVLDRTTVTLASSLDLSETIQQAARAVVPELADWCLIDLANEEGELGQAAAAHLNPEKEELARRLGREVLPALQPGAPRVFATGQPEMYPAVDGTGSSNLLRELGVSSYLCVPIPVRGRTQGVLNLLRGPSGGRYGARELGLAEELARRIGLAVDNARLFRDAQDAIRARDEFLQIASHELKTPLTPLQLQLDILTRALQQGDRRDERMISKLATATRQTARLGRLVDSLLDVSRITGGQLSLELDRFDLSELIREVAERLREEARSAGSELKLGVAKPIVGRWDRSRLDQVVSNLLSNAIKYGSQKPIEIEVAETDDTASVTIRDRGIGIEKDVLRRLFGRFERGVSVRHYGGLGLGLYIARQVAEAHGGTITVQSQPAVGSTFTLVLPRTLEGQAGVAARGTAEPKRWPPHA